MSMLAYGFVDEYLFELPAFVDGRTQIICKRLFGCGRAGARVANLYTSSDDRFGPTYPPELRKFDFDCYNRFFGLEVGGSGKSHGGET